MFTRQRKTKSLQNETNLTISIQDQLLDRNVKRFRGGLAFKAHKLRVSLTSGLESDNKEEEEEGLILGSFDLHQPRIDGS